MRVRIFIDFWNLQLTWNHYCESVLRTGRPCIAWRDVLPRVLCSATDAQAVYVGTSVFASVDRSSESDRKLCTFLQAMAEFPGYRVKILDRKLAKEVRCTSCGSIVDDCPVCRSRLRRRSEKGVDTSLVTELLATCLDRQQDCAVLVSQDSDFVPAAEFLGKAGIRVVHAGFPPGGRQLRGACWSGIDLRNFVAELIDDGAKRT